VKLCGQSPLQTPNSCDKTSVTVPGEGTYTVNTNGTVTFDPEPTFTGTVTTPVTYQVADTLDRTVHATITPTVSAPAAPTATPDTKLVVPGGTATFTTITGTSGLATGTGLVTSGAGATCIVDPATSTCGTSVTIPGEGTFSLNQSTNIVSYTALSTATAGTKSAVTYRVTDVLGQTASSTLTPIIPLPPSATDDTSRDEWDVNQTLTPLANDTFLASVPADASTIRLCSVSPVQTPNNCDKMSVTVSGEGTYTLGTNGTVTFDPLPTFIGTVATPVRYQVADVLGQTVSATLTPTVVPPPIPQALLDTGSAMQGRVVKLQPWLNDSATTDAVTTSSTSLRPVSLVPSSIRFCGTQKMATSSAVSPKPEACTLTSLTTADGKYTVDTKTGVVTFVHRKGFVGQVTEPVTYQIANNWSGSYGPGLTTAELIPTIIPPNVPSVSVGDLVWRDLNGDGYQGPADYGIAGVRVSLFTAGGKPARDLSGDPVASLVTNKYGKYRFTNLPAGKYMVRVTYPPGYRSTIPDLPGRERNSSTNMAVSRQLAIGEVDNSLDFGMVPKMKRSLAYTK
jgi:CshA-type fibril repeat protein